MQDTPIELIEDHDEAYYFWKKIGVFARPLIHLDAHIDFNFHAAKPPKQTLDEAKSKKDLVKQLSTNLMYNRLKVKEKALTNIGNYIYPGMRDGIVTDFYWVIPGGRKEFKDSLKAVRNIIRSFFPRDPLETRQITHSNGVVKAKVYGRSFFITTLDDLPEEIDGALLDIDTDYLTTDTIQKSGAAQDAGRRFPWIWPDELAMKLKKKKINPACITVAYSVNGGFTPLVYKFLGDEIALTLSGSDQSIDRIISKKKEALEFLKNGNLEAAIRILSVALEEADDIKSEIGVKKRLKAHIAFILFRCFAGLKNRHKAKFYYNLAVRSDKTYRARDNNYGPMLMGLAKGLKKAEEEFKNILMADKTNVHALCGLGNIAIRRKRSAKARGFFKKAHVIDKKNREALLGLARTEVLVKNYRLALRYLKEYTSRYGHDMNATPYALLARVYEGLKMFDKALCEYRFAHRFGTDLGLYFGLFKLLGKTGISEKDKEWIDSKIDSYNEYKKNFLKSIKKRSRGFNMKAGIETKRFLGQIDKTLRKIRYI